MNKPYGYDEAEARESGNFQSLPAGNYTCVIMSAEAKTSQSGKQMLVLSLDIADGEFKDYYRQQYMRRKGYGEARWGCMYRQLTEGSHTAYFKGMINAIEESNPGYKWNWDETTLKGKKIGAMFGEEEYISNMDGSIKTSCKPRYVCSVKSLKDKQVLEIKKLNVSAEGSAPPADAGYSNNWEPVESEDDLPF